jgi:transposase
MSLDHPFEEPTAIRTNLGAIFVSLELSRSTWLITSISPGGGEKMSKHGVSRWEHHCAIGASIGA